jgi:hypothetical protein
LDSSIAVPVTQLQTNVNSCLSHLIAYMSIFWQVNMTWHNIPWLSDYIPRSLCRRNTMKIFSPVISCPTMLYHPRCILTIQNATIIVHCLNSGQTVKQSNLCFEVKFLFTMINRKKVNIFVLNCCCIFLF